MACYAKLKDGSWGVRVEGTVKAGETVTVRKKDGSNNQETIARVLWTGNGVSLCSIVQRERSASRGRSRGSSRGRRTGCSCGSIEGEYHDWYCESCRFDELDQ